MDKAPTGDLPNEQADRVESQSGKHNLDLVHQFTTSQELSVFHAKGSDWPVGEVANTVFGSHEAIDNNNDCRVV